MQPAIANLDPRLKNVLSTSVAASTDFAERLQIFAVRRKSLNQLAKVDRVVARELSAIMRGGPPLVLVVVCILKIFRIPLSVSSPETPFFDLQA